MLISIMHKECGGIWNYKIQVIIMICMLKVLCYYKKINLKTFEKNILKHMSLTLLSTVINMENMSKMTEIELEFLTDSNMLQMV